MRFIYIMPGFHGLQGFINCFLCSLAKPLMFYLSKPDVKASLTLYLNRQSAVGTLRLFMFTLTRADIRTKDIGIVLPECKKEKQCTRNIIVRRIRVMIFALKCNKYYIF